MQTKNFKIIQESREFFDLKNRLQIEIEEFEKQIHSEKENIEKIYSSLAQLKNFIQQSQSPYFKIKLDTLETFLNHALLKRKYTKIEFDRIFKTLEKIKETETSEFLNQAIQNKIQKISENFSDVKVQTKDVDIFYKFSYNTVDYFVRGYSKRILYGIDASKKILRIKKEAFPIFPRYIKKSKNEIEYCNLLILKVRTSYQCLRFDKLEIIEDLTFHSLEKKLIPLDLKMEEIKSYIRYKGKRLYFLDI